MKVLLIYATVEGQTGKIANFVGNEIRAAGHEVDLIDANDPAEISFENVDAVILAASVHQRQHPRNFEALLSAHEADLADRKTLLLSVSLNAAFPEGREEANEYVIEMKMRTGLEPDKEVLVAGAVRNTQYDYFSMQVLRHVVLRDRPYDADLAEYEFTDWQALSSDVKKFLA